jgi:hypothetical protein
MDIQFNNLKQAKDAIGIIFCNHNCKLIGYGKKIRPALKKILIKYNQCRRVIQG